MTNLLHEALEELKGPLRESPEYVSKSENHKRWKAGLLDHNEVSVNLRLDWEYASKSPVLEDEDKLLDLMFVQAENDIAELLRDGDVDNMTDALLHVLDGTVKHGKRPVEIEFLAAHIFREFKEKKKTVEFTLFLRLYIRWEE